MHGVWNLSATPQCFKWARRSCSVTSAMVRSILLVLLQTDPHWWAIKYMLRIWSTLSRLTIQVRYASGGFSSIQLLEIWINWPDCLRVLEKQWFTNVRSHHPGWVLEAKGSIMTAVFAQPRSFLSKLKRWSSWTQMLRALMGWRDLKSNCR